MTALDEKVAAVVNGEQSVGLAAALVAALSELTVVEKDAHADMGTFGYDYSTLPGLVKLTRPILAKHGLAVRTPIRDHGDQIAVTVRFLHRSGESLDDDPVSFPRGKDAQATGSAITYYRRYALLAALGMASGDDDDGAKAVPVEARVPGFRSSLVAAVAKLEEDEKVLLREWLEESGLPDRPSLMDADQCEATLDFILNGLPKVEEPAGRVQ